MNDDIADAVVIGSGPNGLVAAITLARKGWDVIVLERNDWVGGAVHSAELTQPRYVHDVYSGFYGLLHASPVFDELSLGTRVKWAQFETPVGAMVSPERAAFVTRGDATATAAGLGADRDAWLDVVEWWNSVGARFFAMTLAPIGTLRPALRFARAAGLRGLLPNARTLLQPIEDHVRERFATDEARALLASGISHSDVPVSGIGSTPMALILAMLAQTEGMPVPVGGAGELAGALAAMFEEAGGKIRTREAATDIVVERGRARSVRTSRDAVIRARHAVIADTGPLQLARDLVGEEHLPARFLDGLRRFRYGTGMFKVDVALSSPASWRVPQADACGVVHLTGTLGEMARAADESAHDSLPANPMLIVGQQSVADKTRAPDGGATLWIECHVPPHPLRDGASSRAFDGWESAREPFLERVLDRIEDHAPGTRDKIVGIAVRTPGDLERENPNLVGGDIGGGSSSFDNQLVFRPVPGWFRYRMPVRGLYICSASAHPGGGVHGMCGRNCARRVLHDSRKPAGVLRTAGGARRTPTR